MLLTTVLVVGITSYTGQKAYKQYKKKKETPWTYYAERMHKNKNKKGSLLNLQPKSPVVRIKQKDVTQELDHLHYQEGKALFSAASEDAATGWSIENPTRSLAISSVSLGFSAASVFYPPLNILGLPGLLYSSFPLYRKSYQDFKTGKVTISLLVAIIVGGLVVQGRFVLGNLIVFLRAISKILINKVQRTSQENLKEVFKLQPRSVWVLNDGVECEIPFDALQIGDLIVIHAGEAIPVDGTIVDGISSIDQHILTGESQPAEKSIGDQVFASTVVLSGQICVRVDKTGDETIVGQIVHILNDATQAKSTVQLRAEQITDQTVLPTLVVGGLSLPFLGATGGLSILASHFKYRLSIVAPLSMLNYLNLASQDGILIKDGITLDLLGQIDTMVFDKTGTLTEEEPHIGKVHIFDLDYCELEILKLAAAAEYKQSHPVARAILKEAKKQKLTLPDIDESKVEVGYGLKVVMGEQLIRVGSVRFMEMETITLPPLAEQAVEVCHQQGHSLVMVALNEKLIGALEMHATVRPEAHQVIRTLRDHHNIKHMYIISGDHEAPTKRLAEELGIEHYAASLPSLPKPCRKTLRFASPWGKAELIKQLQQEGKMVCYIGDGINDSIALQQSQVSISMRGASTMATDTAQIILMDGTLNKLPLLFDVGREFENNMKVSWGIVLFSTFAEVTGILFMGLGLVGVIVINRISLMACLSAVMLPAMKQKARSLTD